MALYRWYLSVPFADLFHILGPVRDPNLADMTGNSDQILQFMQKMDRRPCHLSAAFAESRRPDAWLFWFGRRVIHEPGCFHIFFTQGTRRIGTKQNVMRDLPQAEQTKEAWTSKSE